MIPFLMLSSHWVSLLALGRGRRVDPTAVGPRPVEPLEIYEFESCPYCRKVREVMTELDLSYRSHGAAKGSAKRDVVVRIGGKAQFPLLVDPNTGDTMYESDAIIAHLHQHYGTSRGRRSSWRRWLDTIRAIVAGMYHPWGSYVRAPRIHRPEQWLELFNTEASAGCRVVRGTLASLDLDVWIRNAAPGGVDPRSVPSLHDPNTGRTLSGVGPILGYLHTTYRSATGSGSAMGSGSVTGPA